MSEFIVDTSHLPRATQVTLKEFAVDKVTRCEDCMFYEDGWCHVWEADTIPDGWCYQGAESDEDMREVADVIDYRAVVQGAA